MRNSRTTPVQASNLQSGRDQHLLFRAMPLAGELAAAQGMPKTGDAEKAGLGLSCLLKVKSYSWLKGNEKKKKKKKKKKTCSQF